MFIDAAQTLPHVPRAAPPGASAGGRVRKGGVRTVDVGTSMFGDAARLERVRPLPRRMYTASHVTG